MALVALKCFIMDSGAQSVMTIGIKTTLMLRVVNLDMEMLLELFKEDVFQMGQGKFGWIMSAV